MYTLHFMHRFLLGLAAMFVSVAASTQEFDEPAIWLNGSIVALGQAPAFGVGTTGVTGRLFELPQDNKDGCKPFSAPILGGPWIALVSRGACHFVNKVRNVENANGSAAIIYDIEDRLGTVPIMCAVGLVDVSIPALAVSSQSGETLSKLQQSNDEFHITKFHPFPSAKCDPYFPFKWTALTVCVISGAMLALCGGALMAAFRRRRSTGFLEPIEAVLGRAPHQTTMTGDAVESLPSKIYVPLEEGMSTGWQSPGAGPVTDSGEPAVCSREEPLCSICLEEFQAGQKQRLLPCSHVFHASCVDEWLTSRRAVCPICKQDPTKVCSGNADNDQGTQSAPCDGHSATSDSAIVIENPSAAAAVTDSMMATPAPAPAPAPAPVRHSHTSAAGSSSLHANTMAEPLLDEASEASTL